MRLLLLAAIVASSVFLGLLFLAVLLKFAWPYFSKSKEPDTHDAFRYAGMAFAALLVTILALLLIFLP